VGRSEPDGLLVEREHDLSIVRDAVAEVAGGRSALVVIEGPAGIGKTRLLAEGGRLARETGIRVLSARASELEGELAFGVVRQLFEGALDAAGVGLSNGAPAAVAAELLRGPPRADATALQDASFAILHSLYWLTVALAEESPLVLAVDDLHWCDEPSLRFLNYLIRRTEGIAVAVLCSVRPRERRARGSLVAEIVGDPLARSVRPRPLSQEATSRLIGEGLDAVADETFSTACHTATGGNPLLLKELIRTMQIEGVTPDSEHVSEVSDLGPRAVSRAVLVRLGRLDEDAQRLARAASVVRAGADLALLAAIAELEFGAAAAAASALVAAEILSDEAGVGFVHPLVGEAIYEDMTVTDRSLAHERVAGMLRERGSAPSAVAVHLVLAPPRGEEWVCDVLEATAREALRAGSPTSAVRYLARALSEPPPAARRARVLLELGSAETMLDSSSAIEHLTEAFEQEGDAVVRGEAAAALAQTLLFYSRPDDCLSLVARATAEMEPDSDLRLRLEALELMAPVYGTSRPPTAESLRRRLSPGAGPGAKMLAAVASRQLAFAGGHCEECVGLAREALAGSELIAADNFFLSVTAILTLVRADSSEADEGWDKLLHEARVRGSLAAKAGSSLWRAYASLRRGELAEAEGLLQNALEEFALLGAGAPPRVYHAGFLSGVLRERGDIDGARRVLEAVDVPHDTSEGARYWLDALAEVLLAEERFDEAYVVASDMERRFEFLENPFDTPARSHRAVALYHLGRHDEGLALAAEALEQARRWGAPGSVARALRVLGTLERRDGLDHLRDAVDVVEGSVARLEYAKALVAFGASLRLARRPSEAREPLRRGLELASELGADALAVRARHELRAAGARPRTAAMTGAGALTAAERRVAERAAAGQTNRAIAEALFVTTKTVELHLRNAYRKLGVSSRGELAGALGTVT
jgi:DNA-binding CsgD family transcriptional regulator